MKEYKRLTIKNNNFIDTNCKNCKQCKKVGRKYICNDMTACDEEILQRLAELEDKIENGTLIELPCKVGDTIYYETFTMNGKQNMGIQGHEVLGVRVLVMTKNNYGDIWTEIPLSCFGKDTFITKAEAEAKLKELKENG